MPVHNEIKESNEIPVWNEMPEIMKYLSGMK